MTALADSGDGQQDLMDNLGCLSLHRILALSFPSACMLTPNHDLFRAVQVGIAVTFYPQFSADDFLAGRGVLAFDNSTSTTAGNSGTAFERDDLNDLQQHEHSGSSAETSVYHRQ